MFYFYLKKMPSKRDLQLILSDIQIARKLKHCFYYCNKSLLRSLSLYCNAFNDLSVRGHSKQNNLRQQCLVGTVSCFNKILKLESIDNKTTSEQIRFCFNKIRSVLNTDDFNHLFLNDINTLLNKQSIYYNDMILLIIAFYYIKRALKLVVTNIELAVNSYQLANHYRLKYLRERTYQIQTLKAKTPQHSNDFYNELLRDCDLFCSIRTCFYFNSNQ